MTAFLKSLNWKLNFAVLFLGFVGMISILSVKPNLFPRQLLFFGIGFFLAFSIAKFDWRPFANYKGVIWGIYFLMILILLFTYFFAPVVRGARAWLPIGPFQFQMSEFAKIVLIFVLANFFQKKHIKIASLSNLFASFIYFLIPAVLIAIEPDLGSVLILFSIWFGFLLVSEIRWKHLAAAFFIFLTIGGLMWMGVLKDYQKERILGVFMPERDNLGINYNVVQSKIAIGSGGFFGKGFRQGTQVQLGFLPEAHTDFILASIIEEFGLIAGFLTITAFFILVFEIIKIGLSCGNNFNRFICLGIVIFFSVQFVVNAGSVLGLLPVIGVTFPFVSYGGSSLLANFIALGFVQSISSKNG
ncbi:rod shape-determining protein RodA [Candidatus Wolfebacteria bacterium]|nr:rod shape-determining protein RodA [Candidatus Wolfebacteria bacterium]